MLRNLLLSLSAFVLLGCSANNADDSKGVASEGTVRVVYNTDSIDYVVVKSTAPTMGDISLRLENTRGEVLRSWDAGSELPTELKMVTGSYRLVAWNGVSDIFPSWDAAYWYGENKFKIEAGQNIEAPIVVKSGVVKVKVTFDDSFAKYYSVYSADVRTTTPATPDAAHLNFTPDEDRSGSFLPGTLRLRLRMTSIADGKEYVFSPASPIGAANAAEQYNLNLKIGSTSGNATLIVQTDRTVTEIPMEITNLPDSWLPKPAPKLRSVGFDYTDIQPLTYSEGVAPSDKIAAAIEAPAGIRSVKIFPRSETMKTALGGHTSIEIVGITTELRRALTEVGFTWSEALSTPETAAKALTRVEVRFDELFAKRTCLAQWAADGTAYDFEIQVEDTFDQSTATAQTFVVKTLITAPVFSIATPTEGNVWAHTAEFEVNYNANVAGAEPYIEVRKGSGEWVRADQTFKNLSATQKYYTIKGLDPVTAYSFRAAFGVHRSAEHSFTTEAEQLLTGGDMEGWQASKLGTWPHDIPYYKPWASGQSEYWATNNDRTTTYRNSISTYGYNSFPAVSYTRSAHSGTYAAELRTTSAQFGNTTSIQSMGEAGRLFAGTYSYASDKDVIGAGRAHSSRPVAFSFYYTYTNYNNDSFVAEAIVYSGDVQIGSGTFTSKAGEATPQYEQLTVPITYTNRLLRADRVMVMFRSTNKNEPESRKITMNIEFDGQGSSYTNGWGVFIGSVLRVDDVAFVY